MKPLFVKRSAAWFVVLAVGIVMVGAGLWQAPQEVSVLRGEGDKENPAADIRAIPQKTTERDASAKQLTVREGNKFESSKSSKQNEFFVQYRLERDRSRSQQIDLFREIVNNQNSPEETRKEAQRRLLAITQALDTEMRLETLIKAENFNDAVVFVEEKNVTVIVETPVLTPMDKDRLTGIAARATGFARENVAIIAKV